MQMFRDWKEQARLKTTEQGPFKSPCTYTTRNTHLEFCLKNFVCELEVEWKYLALQNSISNYDKIKARIIDRIHFWGSKLKRSPSKRLYRRLVISTIVQMIHVFM